MVSKQQMFRIALRGVVIFFIFTAAACQSSKAMLLLPVTPALIDDDIGVENMSRLSYFLSKEITLQRNDYFREEVLFEDGVAVKVNKNVNDIITIGTATPGIVSNNVLTEVAHISYRVLALEFEENNKEIVGFAVKAAEPDGRFDILFDDDQMNSIRYNGHIYQVKYRGDERPYLMVKVGTKIVKDDLRRSASGRKAQ